LLGLERLERPEEMGGPGPAEIGQMVHSILRTFYQELIDRQFFLPEKAQAPSTGSGRAHSTGSGQATVILKAAAERAFSDFAERNPVGYPIAWDILREGLSALLEQAVARDLEELRESGYRPVAFECEAADRLPESWPMPLSGLAIGGRMDRIDYQPEGNRYRVIDYKLKFGKSRQAVDKDLLRSALRGQRLQPPFYLLLGKKAASALGAGSAEAAVESAFYFLASQWAEGPLLVERLAAGAWEGETGRILKETIASLVEAIRSGLFFIQPGEYCRTCEVSEACRRNHRPTMWRVERDPRSRAHSGIKEKKG
jgi:ATP-dependent helicase/nuclease subunit B